MRRAADLIVVVVSMSATLLAVWQAPAPPVTFTATATVKSNAAGASAEVTVHITRYATDEERTALIKAMRSGGSAAARTLLEARHDAGYLQLGDRRTPLKYAWRQVLPQGELVTVASADPVLFLGAGLPAAKSTSGFDVAIAILEIRNGEPGIGELAPAARLAIDDSGALQVHDYAGTVVWLTRLVRAQ